MCLRLRVTIMAISVFIKNFLSLLLTLFLISGCGSCPPEVNGTIYVTHWNGTSPQQATLEQHVKNVSFSDVKKSMVINGDSLSLVSNSEGRDLILNFKGMGTLSTNYDYLLMIDDFYKYKITNLQPSTASNNSGCRLKGGIVNGKYNVDIKTSFFNTLMFDQDFNSR